MQLVAVPVGEQKQRFIGDDVADDFGRRRGGNRVHSVVFSVVHSDVQDAESAAASQQAGVRR